MANVSSDAGKRSLSPASNSMFLSNPFRSSKLDSPPSTGKPPTPNELLPQDSLSASPESSQFGLNETPELPLLQQETHIIKSSSTVEESNDLSQTQEPNQNKITKKTLWDSIYFWQSQSNQSNQDHTPLNVKRTNTTTDVSLLWTIPNQVSKLPGLFISQSPGEVTVGIVESPFPTNTVSHITNSSQKVNVTSTENVKNDDSLALQNDDGQSFWLPWKWRFGNQKSEDLKLNIDPNESSILGFEDDESKLFRKLVANAIQCLSYGVDKPVSWGMLKKSGEDHGEVRLTGNKSCKRGVFMKKLPISNFEIQEGLCGNHVAHTDEGDGSTAITISEAIVLPDLKWNYRNLTLKTKTRILLSKMAPFAAPQRHLYTQLEKSSRSNKIKKRAVVISIHGFLPQKLIKNIIHEPTGSADLMSEYANKELKRWATLNNFDLDVDNIELEGYGKLFERINDCISILENWSHHIQNANYLIVVSNSHSVTLAIHVLARLISAGLIGHVDKLGILGISGMMLGPIADIEGKISGRGGSNQENDMISELFDFEDPETLHSKELIRSFQLLIQHNCKITFASSILDCLTPIYSSLGLQFGHANIYRLAYIDSDVYLPDFLVSLINLVLAIKNLNHSDHGLLAELSKFFEGKVQTGKHSGLLRDKHVYRMGIGNILDTSNLVCETGLNIWPKNIREMNVNTYHVPWCLRGLLEELADLKSNWDVDQMMEQLVQEFNSWGNDANEFYELRNCMEAFGNLKPVDIGL